MKNEGTLDPVTIPQLLSISGPISPFVVRECTKGVAIKRWDMDLIR